MAATRRYSGSLIDWEHKLARVMDRLEISDYHWNADRYGGWVEFSYKDQRYRFEHTVAKAQEHGITLHYGTDAFAQIVLSLEDLARMIQRGIYDLSTWVAGMRMLPQRRNLPDCLTVLGFTEYPASVDAVKDRYRQLAKSAHPDSGGDPEWFHTLTGAAREAEALMQERMVR